MNEVFEKYNSSVILGLNKENISHIITFLKNNNCEIIDELLEDYLDIFLLDYNEFVKKFNNLNKKYNNKYLELVKEDMNLLEELFA